MWKPGLLISFMAWAAQGAPPDFSTVYAVFEKAQCRLCHNDNGVASATRLQFPAESADAAEIRAFGLRLRRLVDRSQPDHSLLLDKPTNRVRHTGGERVKRGSEEEKLLRAWVDYLASATEEGAAAANAPRKQPKMAAARLTHSQYNHTVRDLLGDQTNPADQFPKEDFVHGFLNQAEAQSISPLQAEAYNRAAEKLARNAFRGGDSQGLVPCAPRGPDDAECRAGFVRAFGRRVFRRPLADNEAARYERLFTMESAAARDFYKGAQLVVEAMLQSPSFLFRTEPGAYGVASRLSYFLWDTTPDDALLTAAGKGGLDTREQIEKTARRMIADERARASMNEFLAQWLRFDRVRNAIRERKLFPDFNAELVTSMIEETRRLFEHLVWSDRNFMELYTADYSFLSPDLAALYGVPAPKEAFGMVRWPADSGRSGIFGHASILTLTSKPADSSLTERGLFIREHLLCQIVPPPPPGVNTTLPPLTDEKPMTNRQRMAVHMANEACSSCHSLVDPIGYGFEQYDGIGRYREKQIITIYPTLDEIKRKAKLKPTEHQLPIDTTASIKGISGSEFHSPKEAARILANDPGCQRCVVKQLFRYALGRPEKEADQPAIDAAAERFRASQFRFQELIIAIVTSGTFLGG